jgi:hypothetical protein
VHQISLFEVHQFRKNVLVGSLDRITIFEFEACGGQSLLETCKDIS